MSFTTRPCGHAAVEKDKSGKSEVLVVLRILGEVFILDLLPFCAVKISFVFTWSFCLCPGEFGVACRSKTRGRHPQRVKLVQRRDLQCGALPSKFSTRESPNRAVLINHGVIVACRQVTAFIVLIPVICDCQRTAGEKSLWVWSTEGAILVNPETNSCCPSAAPIVCSGSYGG